MATFTRDQILEAASTCTTITALAQRLGCCGTKLSGGTAARLRAIVPELDELLRSNKASAGSSTVCPSAVEKPSQNVPDAPDNPFRQGSVYGIIFHEGSQRYQTKAELISKVAALTGKSPKCIGYSLQVLCRNHSSNKGRSAAPRNDAAGTIKLISLSKKPIH